MSIRHTNKNVATLRDDASRIGEDLRRLGGHAKQIATDKISSVPAAVRGFVEERPVQSLLIALGVGAVLGCVMFRRR